GCCAKLAVTASNTTSPAAPTARLVIFWNPCMEASRRLAARYAARTRLRTPPPPTLFPATPGGFSAGLRADHDLARSGSISARNSVLTVGCPPDHSEKPAHRDGISSTTSLT